MLEETGWNLLNVADSPMTSDACRAREVSMGRTLPGLHGAVVQTGVYAAITACQQGAPGIIGCHIAHLGSCFSTEPAPDNGPRTG